MTRKYYYYYKKKRKPRKTRTKALSIDTTTIRMISAKTKDWDYEYLSELFGIELERQTKDCSTQIHKRAKDIAAYIRHLQKL